MTKSKRIKTSFYSLLIATNILFHAQAIAVVKADATQETLATQLTQSTELTQADTSSTQQTSVITDLPPTDSTLNNADVDRSTFKGLRTFVVSAYYSPLTNQQRYVTHSYSGDIRLNGGGVHGADGSDVYPGMVAAPTGYAFGTKMKIPGVGVVAVHDRGGAIVHAGQKGNSYDRLDIWMGYGDKGLTRALNWGRRTVDVNVYGVDSTIAENVQLPGYTPDEKIPNATAPLHGSADSSTGTSTDTIANLTQTLTIGDEGDSVAQIQQALKDLNFYTGDVNGVFDADTQDAVTKFQISKGIITDISDQGAGFVGPKTAQVLSAALNTDTQTAVAEVMPNNTFDEDLKLGDSGTSVNKLQQELTNLNLLGVDPTGKYGTVTAHAVFKFQQTQGLVGTEQDTGAGVFGAKTRAKLNSIVALREKTQQQMTSSNS